MIPSVFALAAHLSRERAEAERRGEEVAIEVNGARVQVLQLELEPQFCAVLRITFPFAALADGGTGKGELTIAD